MDLSNVYVKICALLNTKRRPSRIEKGVSLHQRGRLLNMKRASLESEEYLVSISNRLNDASLKPSLTIQYVMYQQLKLYLCEH